MDNAIVSVLKGIPEVSGILQFGSSLYETKINSEPHDIDVIVISSFRDFKSIKSKIIESLCGYEAIEYEDKLILVSNDTLDYDVHFTSSISTHFHLLEETINKTDINKMILYDATGDLQAELKEKFKFFNNVSNTKYTYHSNRSIECFLLVLNDLMNSDYYSAEFHLFLTHKHLLTLSQSTLNRDYLPLNAYDSLIDPKIKQKLRQFKFKINGLNEQNRINSIYALMQHILGRELQPFEEIIKHRTLKLKNTALQRRFIQLSQKCKDSLDVLVVGMGYMGLISGFGLALLGHNIIFTDVDQHKILQTRERNPIFLEPGLPELMDFLDLEGRYPESIDPAELSNITPDVMLICVGTPSANDGSTDLSQLGGAGSLVSSIISSSEKRVTIVVRSTVPPLTCNSFLIPQIEKSTGKSHKTDFGFAMVPEFLSEGTALKDFFYPDRMVFGTEDLESRKICVELYESLGSKIIEMGITDAELTKYVSNAFLASKVSFINEVALLTEGLSEKTDISFDRIKTGLTSDHRINPRFLNPGIGFGGSCFKKDLSSLVSTFHAENLHPEILPATLKTNESQQLWPVKKLQSIYKNLQGKVITVLGLTFKPNTDDVRNAPSIVIVDTLLRLGATVKGYDPSRSDQIQGFYNSNLQLHSSVLLATEESDAIILATEWEEFRMLEPMQISNTAKHLILDGRRIINEQKFEGWSIHRVGG